MDDTEARERIARVETLLEGVESLSDPAARDRITETLQAILDLYGEGLARIVGHVANGDRGGLAEALAEDELVSHLLLLHDLHPVPLETRVHGALDEVRPYLESHGGDVELLGVEAGVVRLRLQGSCDGCPSSAMTLKLAIEDAIHKAAPDVEGVEAEGAAEPGPTEAPAPQLLKLEVSDSLGGGDGPASHGAGAWAMAGGLPDLAGGGTVLREVSGERVRFVKVDGTFYAYRPRCPGCHGALEEATLEGVELACAGCGRRYDVRRAGRCAEAPDLHLEPIPLLVDDSGLVKVALGAAAA